MEFEWLKGPGKLFNLTAHLRLALVLLRVLEFEAKCILIRCVKPFCDIRKGLSNCCLTVLVICGSYVL